MKTVPVYLSKLSYVVNNDVVKKQCDKLGKSEYIIDTSRFVLRNNDDTDKSDLEKKIIDADK